MQATRRFSTWCILMAGCVQPLVIEQAAHAQTLHRRYVDGDIATGGLGTSWATAYKYLTDALAHAAANADLDNHYEIWVAAAASPYLPDRSDTTPGGTGDPAASFSLVKFTTVYGGFHGGDPGGEDQLAQRDHVLNETVLSGNIVDPNIQTDNSNHVVTADHVDKTAVLDGFTISGGYILGPPGGAGLLISAFGDPSNTGPAVVRCKLAGNKAEAPDSDGGGATFYGSVSDPAFVNCSFIGNEAYEGGGLHWEGSSGSATIVNCLFAGNEAEVHGGAIDSGGGPSEIISCTFVGNQTTQAGGASGGGGIFIEYPGTFVTNCILWQNSPNQLQIDTGLPPTAVTVSYSDIEGGWSGTGNIGADPLFVNYAAGDYRLSKPCSPCVDAGHPDDGGTVNSSCAVPAGYVVPCAQTCPSPGSGILCDTWNVDQDASATEPTPDLRYPTVVNSAPRVLDGEGDSADDAGIDMGAYEFVRACCPWDCQMNSPADGRVGTDDLNTLLAQWGQTCVTCDFGTGPDGVGSEDQQALLAHWGRCDCGTVVESAAGPESGLALEEALAIMGFDGVDAYIAWGQQATEAEVYASTVVLLAILGS